MNDLITIAIYFSDPERMGYPFDDPGYYASYQRFSRLCAAENIKIYFVRGDSYLGTMRFASGYAFENDELLDVNQSLSCDLIYMKGQGDRLKTDPADFVINDPRLDDIGHDKWLTYQTIGEYMSPTYPINQNNWQEVIEKVKTEKVVLKPITGLGGKGIIIKNKNEVTASDLSTGEAYLAQDFVDSSSGIPGLVDGYHDLRLIIFNGQVKLTYIRTPKPGSLLSNMAQGGTQINMNVSQIPQSAIEVAMKVDEHFTSFYPRIYTVDFMFEGEKPFVCEINTRPGFPIPETEGEDFAVIFYDSLLNALREAVLDRRAEK